MTYNELTEALEATGYPVAEGAFRQTQSRRCLTSPISEQATVRSMQMASFTGMPVLSKSIFTQAARTQLQRPLSVQP